MNNIIISDTSCLIALDKISSLEILQETFTNIITTPEVEKEFGSMLPSWITIQSTKNTTKKEELEKLVDKGEASAIALSLELPSALLIIDEKKGRRLAKELGVHIIGTLRVLLVAKQKNVIHSIKPIIDKLEKNNFRFSKNVINTLLQEAKELN